MFGLLNIDKPPALTSRDVVNRVQRLAKPHKVGHAGTLDPLATGVLVVAVGQATRLVEYVQRMHKTYRAAFLFGRTSGTEDIQGEVVELDNAPVPTTDQVLAALPQFIGSIQQQPPAYSALKVAGRRAHELARRGEAVELESRPVEIYAIEIVRYEYPKLELLIRCGSGTYVRSLGRDVARALGTEAVMSELRREAIGGFRVEDAIPYDELSFDVLRQRLLSPVLALGDMPRIEASYDEYKRIVQGQVITNRWNVDAPEIAALDAAEHLVALLVPSGPETLRAEKCFIQA